MRFFVLLCPENVVGFNGPWHLPWNTTFITSSFLEKECSRVGLNINTHKIPIYALTALDLLSLLCLKTGNSAILTLISNWDWKRSLCSVIRKLHMKNGHHSYSETRWLSQRLSATFHQDIINWCNFETKTSSAQRLVNRGRVDAKVEKAVDKSHIEEERQLLCRDRHSMILAFPGW